MKKLLVILIIGCLSRNAYAATPTISSVSGTVATGQTLTITGSNMVQENNTNWLASPTPNFKGAAYGFEGSNPTADGYITGSGSPTYDTSVKLMGSNSIKYTVSGSSSWPGGNYLSANSYFNAPTFPFYFRAYFRYNGNTGWPTADMKMFQVLTTGNAVGAYWQPAMNGANSPVNYILNSTQNGGTAAGLYVPFPLALNIWYEVEGYFNENSHTIQLWLNGQNKGTQPIDPATASYFILGMPTVWNTSSGYSLNMNMDNFTMSTTRVYPSSLVEISGNNGSTWTAQNFVNVGTSAALSETSSTIIAQLPTLTAANYLLRVTNNQQQTSATYALGGGTGGGTLPTPVNGACGSASGQSYALLISSSPNLCSAGSVASFSGSGPWTWGCNGSSGGISTTSTACYASLASTTAPPVAPAGLLFSESFENNSYASRGWYDNTNHGTIVSGGQSGNSLQWAWASGATTPTNGGSMRKAFTPTDSLYISYYVKFQSGWRGSQKTYHPHMMMILSDLDNSVNAYSPLANNYLNTYIEFLSDVGSPYTIRPLIGLQDEKNTNTSYGAPPNNLSATTENRSVNYCNTPIPSGASFGICYADLTYYSANTWLASTSSVFTNAWHKVEVYMKMNTISGSKGQNNGILQQWIDGVQVLNQNNVLYRTNQRPTLKWAQFVLGPYMGDGSPIAQSMWIDELTVGTSLPSDRTTISPPTGLIIK